MMSRSALALLILALTVADIKAYCQGNFPPKPPGDPDPHSCPPGEIYKECGSACPPECPSDPYAPSLAAAPAACAEVCVEGCFCMDGMLRRQYDHKCVFRFECGPPAPPHYPGPAPPPPPSHPCPGPVEPLCGPNEEPTECKPCDGTCENKNPICTKECIIGKYCRCRTGYVRNKFNHCIPPELCPPPVPPPCGPNEVYSTCGTCDKTCQNRNPICTQECRVGCFCKPGFVRNWANHCIPPEHCPPDQCKEGEIYDPNGSPCNEKRCPEPASSLPASCVPAIIPGCYCIPIFYRRKDGNCVPFEQCYPQPPPKPCPYPHPLPPPQPYPHPLPQPIPKPCPYPHPQPSPHPLPQPCPHCQPHPQPCPHPQPHPQPCPHPQPHPQPCPHCQPHPQPCPHPQPHPQPCPRPPPQPQCRPGEKYDPKSCPCHERKCPESASSSPASHLPVYIPGCYCIPGYFRRGDGKCVLPSQCSPQPQCGRGEKYNPHGSPCNEGKCPEPASSLPAACPAVVVPGCYCLPGYLRRDDGKCVHPHECNPHHQCPPDEVYQPNGCPCHEKKCNEPDPPPCGPGVCPVVVHQRCFCKPGLVRRKDGKCVTPDKCCPHKY